MIPANLITFPSSDDYKKTLAASPVVTVNHERVRLIMVYVDSCFPSIPDDIAIMKEYFNNENNDWSSRGPVGRYTDYGVACSEYMKKLNRLLARSKEVRANP